MTSDLETAQEIFRDHVLTAMDNAAREIFGPAVKRNDAGATDDDLPRLFKALDAQLNYLADRFGVILTTPVRRTPAQEREYKSKL